MFSARDQGRITPLLGVVDLDDQAKFVCSSNGHTRWYFDGGNLLKNVTLSLDNNILTIFPVEAKHAGSYTCFGTNNMSDTFVAIAMLRVYGECV